MAKFIDLTGQEFGNLEVIERAENKGKHTAWLCKCECGNLTIQRADHLKNGAVISCGCVAKAHRLETITTHGMSNTRLFRIWTAMKSRCYCPKVTKYNRYGGRGITVCDEWLTDFQAFYDWSMANGYRDDLTIDRIDNDGNYEPSNCRWATRRTQNNNTSRNIMINYNNRKYTLKEFCDCFNLAYNKTYSRFHILKWSVEQIISAP